MDYVDKVSFLWFRKPVQPWSQVSKRMQQGETMDVRGQLVVPTYHHTTRDVGSAPGRRTALSVNGQSLLSILTAECLAEPHQLGEYGPDIEPGLGDAW